jgi:hypothetical protein
MAKLTSAERNSLPDSDFAGPNRTYPVPDASHARNALSRVSEFGSPALKAKVQSKVHKAFDKIGSTKG